MVTLEDTIGLMNTAVDAHNLGISMINEVLKESGFKTVVANQDVCKAMNNPQNHDNASLIVRWIAENNISVLGFSYRLNPEDGVKNFQKLMHQLKRKKLLEEDRGPIKEIYFAGLPPACEEIKKIYKNDVKVFYGDETPAESLEKFGIDLSLAPQSITEVHAYDKMLEQFGNNIIQKGDYLSVQPIDKSECPGFGTKNGRLTARIHYGRQRNLPPIIRAHAGPYLPNREEAVKQFFNWSKTLAQAGLLDVLSIGTSQLSQSMFGEDWKDMSNGGGVPVNSPEDYAQIWNASRPMLVRTYAGTKNIKELARVYEETMNIAWHALSLWWFSQIDGRGPNSVLENLKEHFETINYIASTGKPLEPNVPHHFAFRGSDDISYVVSAMLSAKVAKKLGIKDFILQTMLNDPKYMGGVHDAAKARASLELVKKLEDKDFRVYLQTRAGLDYLSHDLEKAKKQLASVTALMDDIDPYNVHSPDIIHVVSYSEGRDLATPKIINESIKITRHALKSYRNLKRESKVPSYDSEIEQRKQYLIESAKTVLSTIEQCVKDPYSPEGLYKIFKAGFLPVPQLRFCREEFPHAVEWQTKIRNGCVDVYSSDGKKILVKDRMNYIKEFAVN